MIEVSRQGRTAVVTLDRPDRHNALSIELCNRLREAATDAHAGGARSLVLTGRGSSFCSGADLDEVYTSDFRNALYGMLHAVADLPIPVVAAVNGPAIGAGTQLAIAADVRVVAPRARFAVPTARIGLAVDPWTIRRLALLTGNGAARRLLLTCDQIGAEDSLHTGLGDRAGTLEEAVAWATEMAELAPLTVAYSKRVLNEVFEPALDPIIQAELSRDFDGCWDSADFAEGRRARTEKRIPVFQGR